MEDNTKYDVARELISDILSQQDVSLSVNSGSGIAELKIETELPFRIKEKWATIGDDNRPWHLHLNMDEVVDDGTHMMRSAVSGLPMSPGTLMMLGLELGSIESNDVVSGFAVRGDQTCADTMRCARYYDDFAVSHFYPYLKPDLLWPTSMM